MRTAAALLLMPLVASAASGQVAAELSRDAIRIGEQAELRITAPLAAQWPAIGDTLTGRIEVARRQGPDTLAGDERVELRLAITAFDSGYWAIPPFRFLIGGRPAETAPLLLRVEGYPVAADAEPKDIRPIHELPFSLVWWAREHWRWIAGAAALALLAIAIAALLPRLKRRPAAAQPEAAPLPLHERVLAELDAVERERLWQQGLHKAYQSRVTDLLRAYIEERYQVPALERTTDELLAELRMSPLAPDQQALLANLLRGADLVKFAKALPTPQENEQLMAAARRFVADTAQRPQPHAQTAG